MLALLGGVGVVACTGRQGNAASPATANLLVASLVPAGDALEIHLDFATLVRDVSSIRISLDGDPKVLAVEDRSTLSYRTLLVGRVEADAGVHDLGLLLAKSLTPAGATTAWRFAVGDVVHLGGKTQRRAWIASSEVEVMELANNAVALRFPRWAQRDTDVATRVELRKDGEICGINAVGGSGTKTDPAAVH